MLIETFGSVQAHDMDKLHLFLEDVMQKGLVVDGVVAQDETQIRQVVPLLSFTTPLPSLCLLDSHCPLHSPLPFPLPPPSWCFDVPSFDSESRDESSRTHTPLCAYILYTSSRHHRQ